MDAETRSTFLAAKVVVALGWAIAIAAWFVPTDALWASALRVFVFVLLGIHALEALLFLRTLRRAKGPLGRHIALTLVFGVVHYGEVRSSLAPGDTPEGG